MSKRVAIILITLAILVGSISLVVIGTNSKGNQTSEIQIYGDKGIIVEASQIIKEDTKRTITELGKIVALDEETLYAQADDIVKSVNVRVGDEVKEGEILIVFAEENRIKKEKELANLKLEIRNNELELAMLTNPDNKSDILSKKSEIVKLENELSTLVSSIEATKEQIVLAMNTLDQAKEQVQANEKLFNIGAVTKSDLEKSKDELQGVEVNLNDLQRKIQENELNQRNIESQLELAQYDLNELVNVLEKENRQKEIEMKKNQIAIKQNECKLLEDELNKIKKEVISAVNGTVAQVYVEKNQVVNANTSELVKLIGEENQIVKVELSPDDAQYITLDQKCNIKYIGEENLMIEGRVARISPCVEEQEKVSGAIKKVVPVEIELISPKTTLRSGIEVDVSFILEEVESQVLLPKEAIVKEDNTYFVYAINEDFCVEKKEVVLIEEIAERVSVNGLDEGDKIILNHIEEILVDDKVRYTLK